MPWPWRAHAVARRRSVANEIDVACLAENRLYLIECKTRRWGKGAAPRIWVGLDGPALHIIESAKDDIRVYPLPARPEVSRYGRQHLPMGLD